MNKQSRFIGVTAGIVFGLAGAVVSNALAQQKPGEHPHYLHALADLRTARAWIMEPASGKVSAKESEAVEYIDKAMAEIKRAAIDDGKELKEHEAIDPAIVHKGRLYKAFDLIRAAQKNLHMKEDDKEALGWRTAAIRDVDMASRATGEAVNIAKKEKQ